MARLHWIELQLPGRLATAARPRADDWLDDEVESWKADGVDIVVSLLEPTEARDLGLEREAELCRACSVMFVSFPIPDFSLPENEREVARLADSLVGELKQGRSVVIHCRAGIGRSSVIAACTMISAGLDAADALSRIELARGVRVPDTEAQRAWVMAFEKAGGVE
jgi:protein-tyrosine phosphatase